MSSLRAFSVLVLCFFSWSAPAATVDPKLTIEFEGGKKVFSRKQLSTRKDLRLLEIDRDPAYPEAGKQTYWTIPVSALFEGISMPEDAVIQFYCTDGFSAPVDRERLLSTKKGTSRAYIAIEQALKSWAPLAGKEGSAGPFYLVWENPELSKVGFEEWPFQLAGFRVHTSLAGRFPKILPAEGADASATRGLAVFRKNCFSCHTMNGEGESTLGPDLNSPMNPTEYFQPAAFKALIRDPKQVRHWAQSQMPGFGEAAISEKELEDLVAYLKHMVSRRPKSTL